MALLETLTATEDGRRRLSIGFNNFAHAVDHYVMLIFPTVVIGLEMVYGRPYGELLAIGTASFFAFGIFSLPAGWLADHWSRRNMMAVFYIGCGLSLVAAALAPNLVVLAVALFALGVFAAIYHPVGTAIVVAAATNRGRTLAFNGVCGNLGVALAAGITAALTAWIGWRGAFMIPAAICIATGIAYVAMVPDDRHQAARRSSAPDVRLAIWIMASVFALFILIGVTAGLVFNTITIALPKVIDERIGTGISLVAVGGIATAVFLCGAIAQFTVGRVLDRYPPHLVFAAVALLQFVGVVWVCSLPLVGRSWFERSRPGLGYAPREPMSSQYRPTTAPGRGATDGREQDHPHGQGVGRDCHRPRPQGADPAATPPGADHPRPPTRSSTDRRWWGAGPAGHRWPRGLHQHRPLDRGPVREIAPGTVSGGFVLT